MEEYGLVLNEWLIYALERTYEVVDVVWHIPFFWIPAFTFGDVFVASFVLLIVFSIFFKIML